MRVLKHVLLLLAFTIGYSCSSSVDETPSSGQEEEEVVIVIKPIRPGVSSFILKPPMAVFHDGENYGALAAIELEANVQIEKQGVLVSTSSVIDPNSAVTQLDTAFIYKGSQLIENLNSNTTYFAKAFIKDSLKTYYSNTISFRTDGINQSCLLVERDRNWDFNIGSSPKTNHTEKFYYNSDNRLVFSTLITRSTNYNKGSTSNSYFSSYSTYQYSSNQVEIIERGPNDTTSTVVLQHENKYIFVPNSDNVRSTETRKDTIIINYNAFINGDDQKPDSTVFLFKNDNLTDKKDYIVQTDTTHLFERHQFTYHNIPNPYYERPIEGSTNYAGWSSKQMLDSVHLIDLDTNEKRLLVSYQVGAINNKKLPLDFKWSMAITNDHTLRYQGCN